MKKRIKIFLLIMLVIVFFTVLFIFNKRANQDGARVNIKRLSLSLELAPISNNSIIICNNGIIVEGEGIKLGARSVDGKSLWSLSLEYPVKNIIDCGRDFLVVTEGNNLIILNSSGKRQWQYEMPMAPSSILTSANGFYLIQYDWHEHNTFEIYNTNGEKQCAGIIDKAHVLSFDTYSGKTFTLSILDTSTDELLSKIAAYNNNGEILWAKNLDSNLASRVKYTEKENVLIISEETVGKYNGKGNLLKEVKAKNNICLVDISDSQIVMVVKEGSYYEIYSYDTNLKQLGSAAVKNLPKGIFAGKNEYLIYQDDLLMVSGKNGKTTGLYESNFDINQAYFHDNSIFIVSNRRLLKLSR